METRIYVDEKVVAKMTGFSLQTLRNHRHLRRGIPYYKLGRSVRYCLEDVKKYFDKRRISTQDSKKRQKLS